ncbi:hypothetical protein K9N68_29335 [Kovacikia minuta CCNUW1]|uniref:hypothetical protein n=1 Tax=Kovacikia minuta TaxID=2931930 RepID=UPI001CCE62AA|nr:hypothetical protein [Kovacikia minuta]UBF25625.1 hypothetical protein K9N68_29335 [Kovacikia minuta CCNUW1]
MLALEDVLKVAIVLGKGKAFGKQSLENSRESSPACFAPAVNDINRGFSNNLLQSLGF